MSDSADQTMLHRILNLAFGLPETDYVGPLKASGTKPRRLSRKRKKQVAALRVRINNMEADINAAMRVAFASYILGPAP